MNAPSIGRAPFAQGMRIALANRVKRPDVEAGCGPVQCVWKGEGGEGKAGKGERDNGNHKTTRSSATPIRGVDIYYRRTEKDTAAPEKATQSPQ